MSTPHRAVAWPRVKRVAALVGATLSLAATAGAHAQEAGDARRGLQYAQRACAECHAVLEGEQQSPRLGVATFKTIASTPGMTALALSVWLQSPHPTMPNLVIDPDDRADVIAYIVSLRERR